MEVCVISYVEQTIGAARRIRRGESQLWCPTCGLWRWPEECDHPDRRKGVRRGLA